MRVKLLRTTQLITRPLLDVNEIDHESNHRVGISDARDLCREPALVISSRGTPRNFLGICVLVGPSLGNRIEPQETERFQSQ